MAGGDVLFETVRCKLLEKLHFQTKYMIGDCIKLTPCEAGVFAKIVSLSHRRNPWKSLEEMYMWLADKVKEFVVSRLVCSKLTDFVAESRNTFYIILGCNVIFNTYFRIT